MLTQHCFSPISTDSVLCSVLFEVDWPGELGVVTFVSEHTVTVLLVEVTLDGVWTRRVAHPLLCKIQENE